MKVTEKEAGQQLVEGVALAHSAQIMEIQDTDYEINELGGQTRKGCRGLQCWSCGGFDHLQRNCKTGCDDDDDQLDGPDQKVSHMRNTLVTELDVTSSMMEEMYRQLASAQLRGRLYKTGYRRTKASPKEVEIGTTGQSTDIAAGCGVSTVTTGTPGPPVPGTPQIKTPPRLVRLVTVPRARAVTMQTVVATSPSSPVPQMPIISMKHIQDKTPQVVTTIKQDLTSVTTTASAWKVAMAVKRRGRPKTQPVATCQVLDTIEELDEDSQVYPSLDFGETESGAADLCEILEENSENSVDEPLIGLATDQT